MAYNFKEIEKKWQNKWEKEGTFHAENNSSKKKWYGLIEFPYPSGQGLLHPVFKRRQGGHRPQIPGIQPCRRAGH